VEQISLGYEELDAGPILASESIPDDQQTEDYDFGIKPQTE
jgi:hypothetical protein